MARRLYARRYAEAVFQIALEKKDFDGWQTDLNKAAAALGDDTIAGFLENPRFPVSEKDRILIERFSGINPLVLNLVRLLMAHGNLRALPDIADEYGRLVDEHLGVGRAEITTAVPLDGREQARLVGALEKTFGKQIKVTALVDPAIVGGLIARVDGKLLDGSTRSRLLALRQAIAGVRSGEQN